MHFTNPIVPGFAPDPSVVLVKDTFYLVNSSFHVFPGLPIYTSKNLQDWKLVGHAVCRPSQLDFSGAFTKFIPLPDGRPLVITGGLFAPTIRHHSGAFYVVCTNAYQELGTGEHKFQNFIISCPEEKILSEDGWSDPIPFDFPGIDPSIFFDSDTGRAFIHGSYRIGPPWAPDCSIRQFEVDVSTGKALSDIKLLWKGVTTSNDAEGPHLYKKDGWFYLITADGSTFEGHEINIARAKDIWGPYEAYENNPLLTAHNKEEAVRWTGHGDLFQDQCGKWFCVHLGIRYDATRPERHPMGRETFLTPVEWPSGEWLSISQTKLTFDLADAEEEARQPRHQPNLTDNRLENLYIRTPNLDDYAFYPTDDTWKLHPQLSSLSYPRGTTTFVGRRQRALAATASATLNIKDINDGAIVNAGLAVYKDCLRYASIFYDSAVKAVVFEAEMIENMQPSKVRIQGETQLDANEFLHFRIEAYPDKYDFLWSSDRQGMEQRWATLGSIDLSAMSGYDMTGTIFGIWASNPDSTKSGLDINFHGFHISSKLD